MWGNFRRWYICLWHRLWCWFHKCRLTSKLIKFYILIIHSFLYVTHSSIKWLKNENKEWICTWKGLWNLVRTIGYYRCMDGCINGIHLVFELWSRLQGIFQLNQYMKYPDYRKSHEFIPRKSSGLVNKLCTSQTTICFSLTRTFPKERPHFPIQHQKLNRAVVTK